MWCAACSRPSEVPNNCAERRHAAACEIACGSQRIFERKFQKIFAAATIFRSKSREIAPKIMPLGYAQLAHDPRRSRTSVPSVGMLRRVRLRAILSGFPTEFFENFSRPQNFAFGIARDRAEIRAARRCAACSRPAEVANNCAERRYAAAREITCDSRSKILIFENWQFFAAA